MIVVSDAVIIASVFACIRWLNKRNVTVPPAYAEVSPPSAFGLNLKYSGQILKIEASVTYL